LDNVYPYSTGLVTSDNAGAGVEARSIRYTAQYTMWMMYKPPGAGAIPVPLKTVDWGFGAAGAIEGGKLKGQKAVFPTPIGDTITHPTWTRVVKNKSK